MTTKYERIETLEQAMWNDHMICGLERTGPGQVIAREEFEE